MGAAPTSAMACDDVEPHPGGSREAPSPAPPPLAASVAMGLVAATTLLFEIVLTRLLSVVLWYHWAFFVVSVALLGLAIPGVLTALFAVSTRRLAPVLATAGVALPLAVVAVLRLLSPARDGSILLAFAVILPAFLMLGTATCLLLLAAPGRGVARIYGADLVGAGAGALAVVPLLTHVPTPAAAALLGLLPLVALLVVQARAWPLVLPGLVAVSVPLLWQEPLRVGHTKTYREGGPGLVPITEVWTPTVRLTVFDHVLFARDAAPFAWGPGRVPSTYEDPGALWIEQDGSAGTPIPRLIGAPSAALYLFDDVTAIAHAVRPSPRVAVIGAGGGRDVLAALAAGGEAVLAIELHAELVLLVRDRFREHSGGLYERPEVTVIAGDGREVIAGRADRFDLVQLSLIDSWAATAAGAYTLAENHLYTREAFRVYWSRLTPTGMISASRWMRGGFGLELPRLLLLARALLVEAGVGDVAAHVAVVQGSAVGTVLIARSPFEESELLALREEADARGFVVHLPRVIAGSSPGPMADLFDAGPAAYARHGLDLAPPTDDRPFFFQVVSPFAPLSRAAALDLGVNGEGVWALQQLLLAVSLVAVALLALPFFFAARFERGTLARGSTYFAAIGLAFLLVELAWLGRAALVLGHPSRAATVVLGALLVGSGVGAHLAGILPARWRVPWMLGAAAAVAATTSLLGWLAGAGLTLPWGWRASLVTLGVGLAGVVMGALFPFGMLRFGDGNKAYFWAMNGAASVVAAAYAVALAMTLGWTAVALLGAAFYVVASVLGAGAPAHAADGEATSA